MYIILVPCPLYNDCSHTYISSIDLSTDSRLCIQIPTFKYLTGISTFQVQNQTPASTRSLPHQPFLAHKYCLHSSYCCLGQKYWNTFGLLFFLVPHPVHQQVLLSLTSESDHFSNISIKFYSFACVTAVVC